MYFVIYDTIHLWQNYSVEECETEEEAFKKLDEAKKLHGWSGWVAKEIKRPTSMHLTRRRRSQGRTKTSAARR